MLATAGASAQPAAGTIDDAPQSTADAATGGGPTTTSPGPLSSPPPAPSLTATPTTAGVDDQKLHTQFFPLPLYATLPSEGSTYGVMPVIMRTRGTGPAAVVYSITAPSVSWNKAAGFSGTFRYYRYLDLVRSYSLIASGSTHVNRTIWLTYDDITRAPRATTKDAVAMVRRNLFYRFFGLGPDSTHAGQSSYTRTTALASGRWGWNLTPDLNLGPLLEIRGDRLERHPVFNLPALQDAYPNVPGLGGAAVVREGASLRFDTREGGDYADRGLDSELAVALAEGIAGVGVFGQVTFQTRVLVPENPWLQFAARVYWTQLIGSGLPFYYRAELGGEFLLRGYSEDRFFGMGAWETEIEQRIRFLQTHFFGVNVDWRVDPFITAGQVYDGASLFSHVRVAGGLGLRAWVRPNVVGRVDLAYSEEGFNAYVVLGYPF